MRHGPARAAASREQRSVALQTLARWTAGLALRQPGTAPSVTAWEPLLDFAVRERCASLAWHRSADTIRAHAPATVAARWRELHLTIAARGHAQLATLAAVSSALSRHGVEAVWLKGAPLAQRLYGDAQVRASTDVDWFVAPASRERAHEVMRGAGWTQVEGDARGDATWSAPSAHGALYVELHASLLHPRLGYLPVPAPESVLASVDGFPLRVQGGPLVPSYLAAHLASHPFPPLLWSIDLCTLWDALSPAERREAESAARGAGLQGYLSWAVRRALDVRRLAAGDERAASRLGYGFARRSEPHPMWRHARLAPGLGAAYEALRGWIAPEWVTSEYGAGLAGVVRRLSRHWRAALRRGAPGGAPTIAPPPPVVTHVAGERMLTVAREALAVGGEMWIVVTGHSMQPTLAPGDRVLLSAFTSAPREGDIVLVDAAGQPRLHRVVAVAGQELRTRGDGCATDDPPVALARVVARASAVAREGVVTPLGASLRFGAGGLARLARLEGRRVAAAAGGERSGL